MRFRDNMTPVVGTALAAVAAGCLVLFSLVLQQSAFESPISRGLRPMAPNADGRSVTVAAPEDETGTGGDGSTVAENETGSAPTTPTTGTETFSPAPDAGGPADDSLVASVDDDSNGGDGDFPTLGGGTGSTIVDGSDGPTLSATGPQATINKDPDSQPDDVTLPDRRGPRNSAPPHGSPPRSDDDRDEDDDESKGKDDKDDGKSKGKDGKSKGKDDKDDGKSKGKDDKPKGKDDDDDDESKGKDDEPKGKDDKPKGKDDKPKGKDDDDDDEPKGKDDNDDDSGGPGGKGKPIASPGNSKSDGSGPEGRPAKPQPKPATPEEPSTPEKPAKPAAPPQREAPEANVPKDSQKSKGKPRTGGKK